MKKFKGGVHPCGNKALASASQAEKMPIVSDYYVSLSDHIGAPAVAVVNAGDKVSAGQMIAKANGDFSANVYSPVCGDVVGVEKRALANGAQVEHIHIKSSEEQCEGEKFTALVDPSAEEIKARIAEAGIVGMGGAGFPTALKLAAEGIETVIINGCECEPYLTCDDCLMQNHADEIAIGAKLIAKAVGATNVIIAVEDNKPDALGALAGAGQGVTIVMLPTRYPQGAEKQLVYACTKKKIAPGRLPSSVGVVVDNVATAYAVYDAVINGNPLTERIVTVSGKGIAKPQNVIAKIGTPLSEILNFCGGLNGEEAKIVAGGVMTGTALCDTNVVSGKTSGAFLALAKSEISTAKPTACISCGKCAEVCPMQLEPMYIDLYANTGDYDLAKKYGALNCMQCGACAYVCPAKRDIIASVRLTKIKTAEK